MDIADLRSSMAEEIHDNKNSDNSLLDYKDDRKYLVFKSQQTYFQQKRYLGTEKDEN